MIIKDIQVKRKSLPYKDSNWKVARGFIREAKMLFINIVTNEGLIGNGCTSSGAVFFGGETEESIETIINNKFKQALVGKNPFNIEEIVDELDRLVYMNYRAKAGIDFALHDLIAKAMGVPVYNILGGKNVDKIPIMRLIGIKEPEDMAQDANDLLKEGYKIFKVKIGVDIKTDIERIKMIREVLPEEAVITVDANGSYSAKEAIKLIEKLQTYNVSFVEQPVKREDIDGLAEVTKNVSIPVEADECVVTLTDAARVAKVHAADFISVKPIKVGGLHKAKKIASLCEAFGIKCVVGATPGSQLTDVANAHFFVSTSNTWLAAEIGEFVRMNDDPVNGAVVRDGCLEIPDGPGFGLTINL